MRALLGWPGYRCRRTYTGSGGERCPVYTVSGWVSFAPPGGADDTQGRATAKMRGSLCCAMDDETVHRFGRDDAVLGGRRQSTTNSCEGTTAGKACRLWRRLVVGAGVGHGVVAFAGLDLLVFGAGDVEGAEAAVVDLGVGGGVAGEILGAELVLDLVEGFLKLFAVVAYVDDAAAGLVGEAVHVAGAVAEAEVAEAAAVGDEDDVDDGVGFLGGFDGGLEGLLRTLVAAVGEGDED